jgi:hypothetical protein
VFASAETSPIDPRDSAHSKLRGVCIDHAHLNFDEVRSAVESESRRGVKHIRVMLVIDVRKKNTRKEVRRP